MTSTSNIYHIGDTSVLQTRPLSTWFGLRSIATSLLIGAFRGQAVSEGAGATTTYGEIFVRTKTTWFEVDNQRKIQGR